MKDKSKSTRILITGSQRDGVEKIFFKIMKINIPGLMNDRILQNEKVLRGPNRIDKKKIRTYWASLVAQWLRVCLLMQGTRVRALVWEDPTCRGAAGPVSHNC